MGRGRVKLENGTVVTDRSERIRGGTAWVYSYGDSAGLTAYSYDPSYYEALAKAQLNAVRVICFDPWQRSRGYPGHDVTKPDELHQVLQSLDKVVTLTEEAGLYAMINYHDVGQYDRDSAFSFWQAVSVRYARRQHVFFELLNEPVKWFPEDYTDQVLDDQQRLYQLVRDYAPDTHIVMLTFPNIVGAVEGCTMESVTAKLSGVDWSNASVGFHCYRTDGSSAAIQRLRKTYPVLNTEVNVPRSHGGPDYLQPMDGHAWVTQTMETIGVSWFAWEIEGPEKFSANYVNGIWADARQKGYEWKLKSSDKTRSGVLGRWREEFSALPIGQCSQAMGLRWTHILSLTLLTTTAVVMDMAMLAMLIPMLQIVSQGDSPVGIAEFIRRVTSAPHLNPAYAIVILGAIVFLLGVLKNALLFAAHLWNSWLYGQYARNLSLYVFGRYLVFGKSYFDRHETGQLNALVDAQHDVLSLYQTVQQVIATTLLLVGYFSIMLWISWRLSLLALLMLPALHLASRWVVRRTTETVASIHRTDMELGRQAWQMLGALSLFRAFAKEEEAVAVFRNLSEERRRSSERLWKAQGVSARLLDIAVLSAILLMLVSAFVLEPKTASSMMNLLVFFFVARVAMPEIAKYQSAAAAFAERLPKAMQFATVFEDRNKFIIPDGTRTLTGVEQSLEFRNLTFRYPDGPEVLKGVSFQLTKGTMTALVGPSGAGKSTLTHLLLRFYDVPPGTILIDSIDLRDFTAVSVRRNIALVSQDVILLSRTLRENLTFGAHAEVSEPRLRQAIEAAQLQDLISSLPEGLDTPLGDHGQRLSGGERQRVALGRALLAGAPLLILDEATSALDSLTEARVQQAVETALQGCTSLVIAHRLATIRKADQIVVLDRGQVVEQGTLQQLIDNRGLFWRMWEQQAFR